MNGEDKKGIGRREGEVGKEKATRVSSVFPRSSSMSALLDLPLSTCKVILHEFSYFPGK